MGLNKEHLKFGMVVRHNNIQSTHHTEALYIVVSYDGLGKNQETREWKPMVEYYNLETNGKYFRDIDDFCTNFDFIYQMDLIQAKANQKKILLAREEALKGPMPPKFFDFLKDHINKLFLSGDTTFRRSKMMQEYRKVYSTDCNSGTLDQYRRMLTKVGYLENTEGQRAGIYTILKMIPAMLNTGTLSMMYEDALKDDRRKQDRKKWIERHTGN